jgi:chemotaxis methyl-accepting protein methylase
VCRHRVAQTIELRANSTFTGFLRLPSQFVALSGPVLDFLARQQRGSPLCIVVMGCSNGAEAYTIASVLLARSPGIEFRVDAYDIDGDIVTKARSACFHADEVLNNKILTPEFVQTTFDIQNGTYRVKKDIAARVRFHIADVLSPDLATRVGRCDILFAQNFLFHLNRKDAHRAFDNLCELLNLRAALFVDGMDLGLRQKRSRARRLVPLEFRIEEIHNEARRARAAGWPDHYWGLEPFKTFTRDWQRRYATIYLKDTDGGASLPS